MYHNEFFHKDSFGSAPVGRTFQRSVLRQKAEMYVTCTVLNKKLSAVEANIIFIGPPLCTPCTPLVPKVRGTLTSPPHTPRLRRPCMYVCMYVCIGSANLHIFGLLSNPRWRTIFYRRRRFAFPQSAYSSLKQFKAARLGPGNRGPCTEASPGVQFCHWPYRR